MIGDLDGDGLKDLVLMDDLDLAIFYQAPTQGFTREPQQTCRLEPRPCLLCTAKLGGPAESVLVLNSDGVTELCFTNRTGPPAIRQIIRQPTIFRRQRRPAKAPTRSACRFRSETGRDWPLLLVPAADGTSGLVFGNIATSGVRYNSSAMPLMPACGRQWPIPDNHVVWIRPERGGRQWRRTG